MTMKNSNRMWDANVMAIEEIVATYAPKKRDQLKKELIEAIEFGDGSDAQKTLAKNVLNTALSNVYLSNGGIEKTKCVGDQIEIANRLYKLTGIVLYFPEPAE